MSQPQPAQPKIVQKLLVRTTVALLGLAAVFGVYRWATEQKGDFDRGGDSAGMLAAVRLEDEGQQVVLIKPDGSIVGTQSWKPGVTDREPMWSPDGRFLFFCSDREDSTFNVFRWNPDKDDADSRTFGRTSRSNPTFAPDGALDSLLIIAGGAVRELDPSTKKTPQVLPPTNAEIAQSQGDEGPTTEGSFSAIYGSLGKSFRLARYIDADKRYIAAIMRRDEGELLVLQDLQPVNEHVPKPRPVVAGDRIDFDVSKDGTVAFSVQNFRWPDPAQAPEQFRKGNRITVPFRNLVGLTTPTEPALKIVAASSDDKTAFGSPRIGPDGARMLLIQGEVQEGSLRPVGLLTLPVRERGIAQASPLLKGEVYEPAWSPDGKRIAYAKRVNGKRDLYTMTAEGSDEKNLTGGKASFMTPLFSPQSKP